MNEVDEVVDNKFKTQKIFYQDKLGDLVNEAKRKSNLFPEPIKKFSKKTRALLQIQQGCDHRCTFCIIPYGRGDSISLPLSEIVIRAEKFLNAGYQEITITGVDITSYGNDLPGKPKLGEIIKRLLISKIFGVAETYENEPEIYFPLSLIKCLHNSNNN